MCDSFFGGASRPQWADEVFSDVVSSFQDWELRLNSHDDAHPQPCIFTRAVDLLKADIMKIYRQASGFFGHDSGSEDTHSQLSPDAQLGPQEGISPSCGEGYAGEIEDAHSQLSPDALLGPQEGISPSCSEGYAGEISHPEPMPVLALDSMPRAPPETL